MKNINVIRSYRPVKDIQDILDYIYMALSWKKLK